MRVFSRPATLHCDSSAAHLEALLALRSTGTTIALQLSDDGIVTPANVRVRSDDLRSALQPFEALFPILHRCPVSHPRQGRLDVV